MKQLIIALSLLLISSTAYAFQCESSQAFQQGELCVTYVTVASDETSLVSEGTVLVYDVNNYQETATAMSYQVELSDASGDGVFVAGIATGYAASGDQVKVVVRGKTVLAVNSSTTIASGDVLFVSASGDATEATSTTQNQLGFALEDQAGATGTTADARTTIDAFITIV